MENVLINETLSLMRQVRKTNGRRNTPNQGIRGRRKKRISRTKRWQRGRQQIQRATRTKTKTKISQSQERQSMAIFQKRTEEMHDKSQNDRKRKYGRRNHEQRKELCRYKGERGKRGKGKDEPGRCCRLRKKRRTKKTVHQLRVTNRRRSKPGRGNKKRQSHIK